MFQTLRNAFKVKDIRSKIFYTFLMLVVVRLGSRSFGSRAMLGVT